MPSGKEPAEGAHITKKPPPAANRPRQRRFNVDDRGTSYHETSCMRNAGCWCCEANLLGNWCFARAERLYPRPSLRRMIGRGS